MQRPRRHRLITVAAAFAIAGCYGGATTPTPDGPSEVMQQISLHGLRITLAVGGDAPCEDRSLVDNANHLRVTLPPDTTEHDLYLFTFRSRDYEAEAPAVDACQAEYAKTASGSVERVDVAPYRAFGSGWTPQLRAAVTDALSASSRGGTTQDGTGTI